MARSFYIEDNEIRPAIKFVESQPVGYSLVTDPAKLSDLYYKKYKEYEVDGHSFYNNFRVQLAMSINNGITPEEAFEAEAHLNDVKDNLITGNWLTAQFVLNGKALVGIFDQALKDEIMAGITNYITDHY